MGHHVSNDGDDDETPAATANKKDYGTMEDEERPSTAGLVGVNKIILKTIKPTFDIYATVPEEGEKYLDADELNIVFKEFGIKKPANELKLLFAEFDTDGNGQINLQ